MTEAAVKQSGGMPDLPGDYVRSDRLTDGHIAGLVPDGDAGARAFGRLLATGVADTTQAFITSEISAGTDPAQVMATFVRYAACVVGSILAPAARDGHVDDAAKTMGDVFARAIAQHARAVRGGRG